MDQKSPEAFRTISEVAEWLGVPTHVLRFWESRFAHVKPVKRAGGRRYYRPADMELLGGIRKLLHEDGMTIRGVQKLLREQGVKHVAAMSPPLDLGADTEDVTPSNVVDLSQRRGEDVVDEDVAEAWEPEAQPDPEPDWATADDAAISDEPAPTWAASDAPEPEYGDDFFSPERVEFHAHDAEPDAFEPEGAPAASADFTPPEPDPEPEPEPAHVADPTDPMDSPEALSFAAHDAEPDTVEAEAEASLPEPEPEPETEPEPEPEPAPPPVVLVMPDIGPDPDDAAYYPDTPPVAAMLRAARAAEADLPLDALYALADRLGALANRIGTATGPRH